MNSLWQMLVNYLNKDTTDIGQFVSLQAILQGIIEPTHYIFPLLSWAFYAKDEKNSHIEKECFMDGEK